MNNGQILLKEYPLAKFVDLVIGDDECRTIDEDTAAVIEALTHNKVICYVQRTTFEGKVLEYPRLWRFSAWLNSYTHYRELRKQQREDFESSEVFKENVRRVKKALYRELGVSGDVCHVMAMKKLKSNPTFCSEVLKVHLVKEFKEL